MTSEPKAPGAPAIILFREVDRDDSIGREDIYSRIKILTEEGRKYADLELPYVKGGVKITRLHARTIQPDGSIVDFDGKMFDRTIVKARGLKYLAKTFTLPQASVGSILEYSYTVEFSSRYVFDSYWILNDDLFTKRARFSFKPARLSGFSLRVQWQHLAPGIQPIEDKNQEVHLEVQDMPAFQVEDFMPPERELKARVDFIYTDLFTGSVDAYWKKFGQQCYGWFESFLGKPKVMEQAVAGIVSPGDSAEVKLEKIYARVQQLRNLSFEEEKTAQEQKWDKEKFPVTAEEVWKWQRGTGIQLTWIFAGLARAAGIEAYGVWVSDRSSYFFDPKTMDRNRLPTNVVLVKLNGKDLYFDPGSAFVPFGMLPWSETGVSGYKLDKDGGAWITTTLPDSSLSRIQRNAEFKLTETGDLEGKLAVTFSGLQASRRRVEERFSDDAERKKFLEDEVKEWIPGPSDVELTTNPEWKSSSSSMLAEFKLRVPDWVSAAGTRSLVPVGLFSAGEKHLFEHAERVHPIYFQFPFEYVDEISITPPAGWQILNLPEPQRKDSRLIIYTSSADLVKDALRLHRELRENVMMIDVKSYPALRDFFQAVRSADEQQVLLQPAAASARN